MSRWGFSLASLWDERFDNELRIRVGANRTRHRKLTANAERFPASAAARSIG